MRSQKSNPTQPSGKKKLAYKKPVLVAYGHIAKLTQNGTGSGIDGGVGGVMAMMCL